MMNEQTILDYINNRLPKEEMDRIKDLIATDEALSNQIESARIEEQIKDLLFIQQGREELKDLSFEQETIEDSQLNHERDIIRPNFGRRWMRIAAGLAILVVSGLFFFNQSEPSDPSELFGEYYIEPYGAGTRGNDDGVTFSKIERLIYEERFTEAINELESLDNDDAMVNYLLAHAHLKNGSYSRAIELFKMLSELNKPIAHKAKYDLAVSYLKMKDSNNTKKTLLEILEDNESPYKGQAKKLLAEI